MNDLTRFAGTDQDVGGLLDRQRTVAPSEAKTKKQPPIERQPIPKHEQGGRFVRGPIPYDWLRAALAFGGKAGNLALAIWWLVGVEGSNPIKLTARVLRDFNISPRSTRRLLPAFERAGLLRVDRQRGRGPVVEIVKPSPEPPSDE